MVNLPWSEVEKRAEERKNSPNATFPFMTTKNGNLCQNLSMAEYICNTANPALLGETPFEKAQISQWVQFARCELRSKNSSVLYPIFGFAQASETYDADMKIVKEHIMTLNKHLEGKSYIVGDKMTLADMVCAFELKFFFMFCFVEGIRKSVFPNVTKWITSILTTDAAIQSLGRFILCKAPLKAPKVEKKKEEPKKKVEEVKPKEEVKEKKKANPLDLLPASKFVLDDFKREFLNSKDQASVMKSFWENYDAQGYSLWHFLYQKLPSEGKVLFKTNNSSSFFLQKLDTFRKYSFSIHGVYGVEENYDIRGVWMMRGTEMAEEMKEQDNYPYMTVRKLDSTVEADRKMVEDYWLNMTPGQMVDGLPVAEVVSFK